MTNLISAISGQFGKALILGTFLPVIIFVILLQIFVIPLFPSEITFLKPLEALDTQWQVFALSILAIILSSLLYNLNIPIIRFYEGYSWEKSWFGKWRKHYHETQFNAAHARVKGMRTLLRKLSDQDKRYSDISKQFHRIGCKINSEFPGDLTFVMPTRLGNTIRSFEHYSNLQYGIEAIVLWPRLIAKISKEYIVAIDDAKASFDFMINSSLLSAVLFLTILGVGLLYPFHLNSFPLRLFWLLKVLVFATLCYLFYLGSISRASAWGSLIKGAFDLYRGELLKQLGYSRILTEPEEEYKLWNKISRNMLFGKLNLDQNLKYAPSSCIALSEKTEEVDIQTTKGFSQLNSKGITALCATN